MATSGTTTYSINRDDLITEALKLIEVLEEGQSATATQLSDSLPTLQMMIKAMSAINLQLWKRTYITISPLVLSQADYEIGPTGADEVADKPLRILDINRKDSDGVEVGLTQLSLNEYESLSNKTTSGIPTQYYFNPYTVNSKVSLWPVPDATAVSDYTVEIVCQTYMEDMTASTTDFDVPVEHMENIKYQLAVRLAPIFGYPIDKRYLLRKEAKEIADMVDSFDTEDSSVFLQPSLRRTS